MQKQVRKIALLIKLIWLTRKLAYISSMVLIPAIIFKSEIIVAPLILLIPVSVMLAEFFERIYISAREDGTPDAEE